MVNKIVCFQMSHLSISVHFNVSFRFQDIAGDFESALDIPFNKPSGIFSSLCQTPYWVYLAKIPYPLISYCAKYYILTMVYKMYMFIRIPIVY